MGLGQLVEKIDVWEPCTALPRGKGNASITNHCIAIMIREEFEFALHWRAGPINFFEFGSVWISLNS